MKRSILLILFGLILAFTPIAALLVNAEAIDTAKTQENELNVEDPGILPDSPFYFFKTVYERIQIFATLNKDKKAMLEMKLANKRLREAQKMADIGKTDQAEKMLQKWQERVDRITQKLEARKAKGEKVENLLEKLKENHLRQQEHMDEIYEKVPENAKDAILKAKERSDRGLENAIEKINSKEEQRNFGQKLEEKKTKLQEKEDLLRKETESKN